VNKNTQVEQLYRVTDAAQVIPVIRYEEDDEIIHTDEHPHCGDDTCPCNANVVDGSDASSRFTLVN
jgi:hypothetical protein